MSSCFVRVIGAVLLCAAPVSVLAQPAPQSHEDREYPQREKDNKHSRPSIQPGEKGGPAKHKASSEKQYGAWNSQWGAKPPAPPAHWSKHSDWHRHVRACQQRYRSYNARMDTYRSHSGKNRRCTL